MIRSLEDLQQFTATLAQKFPALAQRTLLRSPGCNEREISELLAFERNLPRNYMDCVRRLHLKGFSLSGSFCLWPGGAVATGTFVEGFRAANSAGYTHQAEFRRMGLLRVASWNDEPICVAKDGCTSFAPDSILRFEDSDQLERSVVLSQDFEHFLVAAGNVAEIHIAEKDLAGEDRVDLLLGRLPEIGLQPREVEAWRIVAETVFS